MTDGQRDRISRRFARCQPSWRGQGCALRWQSPAQVSKAGPSGFNAVLFYAHTGGFIDGFGHLARYDLIA
jgi:ribosomal protein L32E